MFTLYASACVCSKKQYILVKRHSYCSYDLVSIHDRLRRSCQYIENRYNLCSIVQCINRHWNDAIYIWQSWIILHNLDKLGLSLYATSSIGQVTTFRRNMHFPLVLVTQAWGHFVSYNWWWCLTPKRLMSVNKQVCTSALCNTYGSFRNNIGQVLKNTMLSLNSGSEKGCSQIKQGRLISMLVLRIDWPDLVTSMLFGVSSKSNSMKCFLLSNLSFRWQWNNGGLACWRQGQMTISPMMVRFSLLGYYKRENSSIITQIWGTQLMMTFPRRNVL